MAHSTDGAGFGVNQQEYLALLANVTEQIGELTEALNQELIGLIAAGTPIEEAMAQINAMMRAEFLAIFSAAISTITGEALTAEAAASYLSGNLTLSTRLYANAAQTSNVVETVINRHIGGYQDARALARELYEGYGFNPDEILEISPDNPVLPRRFRRAVLSDPPSQRSLQRAFTRAHNRAVRTDALRAAYMELTEAINQVEGNEGHEHLKKKLKVAYEEKARYYAKRIAETELARAYSISEAREIMADDGVKYVQWLMSPQHPVEDICDYFAGVNLYGLGRGIYPKALAPVPPAHPFCKCVLHKRLDLNGRNARPYDEEADRRFFRRFSQKNQRKIAGSASKLEAIRSGESARDVHNAGIGPVYQVRDAGTY